MSAVGWREWIPDQVGRQVTIRVIGAMAVVTAETAGIIKRRCGQGVFIMRRLILLVAIAVARLRGGRRCPG